MYTCHVCLEFSYQSITFSKIKYNRILGGLLSAHLLIVDKYKYLGDIQFEDYDNELLDMAHDLAARLLPAFDNTKTGIPHPRVKTRVFSCFSKSRNS